MRRAGLLRSRAGQPSRSKASDSCLPRPPNAIHLCLGSTTDRVYLSNGVAETLLRCAGTTDLPQQNQEQQANGSTAAHGPGRSFADTSIPITCQPSSTETPRDKRTKQAVSTNLKYESISINMYSASRSVQVLADRLVQYLIWVNGFRRFQR